MRQCITALFLFSVMVAFGCADSAPQKPTGAGGSGAAKDKEDAKAKPSDKHSGWWCEEHGIPESECLLCLHGDDGCKKKKDWCEMHEFPKSQCFKCNAMLRDFYAAKYRAKYGKEPPPSPEN